MERLAAPQTHLSLKAMIKEVDEDQDGKLSFREVNNNLKKRSIYYYGSCNVFSNAV
jgi:Ca2+-binding EF-hand superfamily protein